MKIQTETTYHCGNLHFALGKRGYSFFEKPGRRTLIPPTPLLSGEGIPLLRNLAEAHVAGLGLRLRSLPRRAESQFFAGKN
jgi:hypothetical protein